MNKTLVFNVKKDEWKEHPTNPGVYIKPVLSGDEKLGFKSMYVKIVPGGEIMPHSHDVTELFYIISGTGHVLVNGARQACGEGTVIVAPPEIEHGVKNDTEQDVYLLANFNS